MVSGASFSLRSIDSHGTFSASELKIWLSTRGGQGEKEVGLEDEEGDFESKQGA